MATPGKDWDELDALGLMTAVSTCWHIAEVHGGCFVRTHQPPRRPWYLQALPCILALTDQILTYHQRHRSESRRPDAAMHNFHAFASIYRKDADPLFLAHISCVPSTFGLQFQDNHADTVPLQLGLVLRGPSVVPTGSATSHSPGIPKVRSLHPAPSTSRAYSNNTAQAPLRERKRGVLKRRRCLQKWSISQRQSTTSPPPVPTTPHPSTPPLIPPPQPHPVLLRPPTPIPPLRPSPRPAHRPPRRSDHPHRRSPPRHQKKNLAPHLNTTTTPIVMPH